MKKIVCFDIGGTFIKYALITAEGEILKKGKYETPIDNCSKTIPESMAKITEDFKTLHDIYSIGVSTAGLVDSEKGIVVSSTNIKDYTGTNISEAMKKLTGLNTFVENDVNAAALGEMWIGAAKGFDNFVCVTLGTGIGGAIVIDGKVVKGVSGAAGELGHMVLKENGETCNCGTQGCYERYASTSAFIRMYINKAMEKGIEIPDISGEEIMKRVKAQEELAISVYNEFLDHVVIGLVSITHILDPGLIVIGGGISAQGEEFFKELNKRFKKKVMKAYSEHTKIIMAKLSNDAGIYGACYAALK